MIESIYGIILGYNEITNWMLLLLSIIIPIVLLTTNNRLNKEFILIIGIILYIAFSTYNILIWYISFEGVVIPMIYLMTKGSSSLKSRYRAIYRFTIYTIIGGILLLFSLLYIYILIGSFNYWSLIIISSISINYQLILFPFILISYLIKLPVIPFHIWLPK
jgi:NADH:ubiquinone oxidoreductase subunit 4 (subunit M)